jgi:threonine/homoserine/homoserine lactone efflux protein
MMRSPFGISLVINIFMATVILALGCALLFTDFYIDVIKKPNRSYLAFIFFAYAGFRYWRAWSGHQKEKRDKQREEWKNKKSP